MADKRVLLTADGLKKLQEKLDFLKGERNNWTKYNFYYDE